MTVTLLVKNPPDLLA